jgi:parvulin-like peptidyl-prolyl isomerase
MITPDSLGTLPCPPKANLGKLVLPLILIVLTGLSCRKTDTPRPTSSHDAVAVIAGREITVQMLRDELQRRFRADQANLTADQKMAALENLIQIEALYTKAQAAGFDRTPEIEARIKHLVVSQFKQSQFRAQDPTVTDEEVEAYYHANQSRFAIPPAVRGAIILLELPGHASPEKKKEFQLRAESILAEARAATAQEFAELVRRHSEDQATRYRAGDIGWLTSNSRDLHPKLFEALAKVETPGDFAPLVSTPQGVFIAKLLDRKDAGAKSLAEIRETIRYQLVRQKAEQAEAHLQAAVKQGLDIQINQALLESVTVPQPKVAPPRMPGTQTAQLRQ